MPIRLRKLIGAVALIVLVTIWSLIAMALAQLPVIKANGLLEVSTTCWPGWAGCSRACCW